MAVYDYASWAATHGCSYQAEAPELVGVWLPPHPKGLLEEFHDVVRGTLFGLEFCAFRYWAKGLGRPPRPERLEPLFVQLPGVPAPKLAAMDPEKAFRKMGGRLNTAGGRAEWRAPNWLLFYRRRHNPFDIEALVKQLAVQLPTFPPEFWRPTGT